MPPQQGVPLAKPFLSPSQMHLDDHRADHHHQDVADVKDAGDAKANVKILQELEEQALSKYGIAKKRGGSDPCQDGGFDSRIYALFGGTSKYEE